VAEPSNVAAETPDVFVLPALEIAFIEPKKLGNESKEATYVMLIAAPEMRSIAPFTQRAEEAQELLERCVRENQGTPWETLAQRELEFFLGVGAREMALTPEPIGPETKQPSLPRF